MDASKQPGITIDSLLLVESHFKRSPAIDEASIKIDVNFKFQKNEKDKNLIQFSSVAITNGDGSLELSIVFYTLYSLDTANENMTIDEFIASNSPQATMYPFLRQYIHDLTLRAGIAPIILSPANLTLAKASPQIEQV